jgi:myo-inositol-1(or 4)-monophosphatase
MNSRSLEKTAIRAAHASGRVLMKYFRTRLKVDIKADQGLVTNADLESERVALRILSRDYPDFGILTEESEAKPGSSPGRWILDPLDGTTNYAHGLPLFCVSIAAEWKNKIVAGVIYNPVTRETFSATLGGGAYLNGVKLRVSSTRKLGESFLSTGFTSRKEEFLSQELLAFERLSLATQGVRRPGSAALDLANVARGAFDGFWERGLAPWDVAAGALIICEAGGKVSDFSGKALQLSGRQIIASNGLLHRVLVQKIQ